MRPAARAVIVAVAIAAGLGAAGDAGAQSERYPAEVHDVDEDAEQRSDFWERVAAPDREPYDAEVATARALLGRRVPELHAEAEDHLRQAVKLLAAAPDAHWYLGVIAEEAGEWRRCADEYGAVWRADPAWTAPEELRRVRGPLAHALAVCLARSGDLEGAIDHLEREIARGRTDHETWLRLGEAYMALGRIGEAVAALERAEDANAGHYGVRWALAVAYDRDRRLAEARGALERARHLDSQRSHVATPSLGYVPAVDVHYYVGLAAEEPEPELAILHFREFIRAAEGSPWRARAREHLRVLETVTLAERAAVTGTATIDRKRVVAAIAAAGPALGKCVARTPGLLVEVRIVQLARAAPSRPPPPPPTSGARIDMFRGVPPGRSAAEAPGLKVSIEAAFATSAEDAAAALACVEQVASKLALPRPTVPGSWVRTTFPVVAR